MSSGSDVSSCVPHTAAVDENTSCFTPARDIACSSDNDPPTLFEKYNSGFATDSPTDRYAAKWTTASMCSEESSASSARVSTTFSFLNGGLPRLCWCPQIIHYDYVKAAPGQNEP
jgi:hypothetical protein